jgi:hypothetical protein
VYVRRTRYTPVMMSKPRETSPMKFLDFQHRDIRLLLFNPGEREIHVFIEQSRTLYCDERPTTPYTPYRLVKRDLGRRRSVRDVLVESAVRSALDQQLPHGSPRRRAGERRQERESWETGIRQERQSRETEIRQERLRRTHPCSFFLMVVGNL